MPGHALQEASRSISDLPSEILVRIFRYLDVRSGICASLVCRSWCTEMTSTSSVWQFIADASGRFPLSDELIEAIMHVPSLVPPAHSRPRVRALQVVAMGRAMSVGTEAVGVRTGGADHYHGPSGIEIRRPGCSDSLHLRPCDDWRYAEPCFSPCGLWCVVSQHNMTAHSWRWHLVHVASATIVSSFYVASPVFFYTWSPDSRIITTLRRHQDHPVLTMEAYDMVDLLKHGCDTERQPPCLGEVRSGTSAFAAWRLWDGAPQVVVNAESKLSLHTFECASKSGSSSSSSVGSMVGGGDEGTSKSQTVLLSMETSTTDILDKESDFDAVAGFTPFWLPESRGHQSGNIVAAVVDRNNGGHVIALIDVFLGRLVQRLFKVPPDGTLVAFSLSPDGHHLVVDWIEDNHMPPGRRPCRTFSVLHLATASGGDSDGGAHGGRDDSANTMVVTPVKLQSLPERVMAFFWSPSSEYLALVSEPGSRDHPSRNPRLSVSVLHFWQERRGGGGEEERGTRGEGGDADCGKVVLQKMTLPCVVTGHQTLQWLRFFEQYDRTLSIWSSDSMHLCYPSSSTEEGEEEEGGEEEEEATFIARVDVETGKAVARSPGTYCACSGAKQQRH